MQKRSPEAEWEQRLTDQLPFQNSILQNVRESIIVTDLQGNISYWNKEATHIFGYQAEEMLGKTPLLLYPDLDQQQFAADLQSILAGNDYINVWKGKRKDGSTVWIDIKTTVLRNAQGDVTGFIGSCIDITERKEFETRKDAFIALVSHELKTPITSLKGFTQVLQRRFRQRGDEQSLRFLDKMDRQLSKFSVLISDLTEISKLQTGSLPLHKEEFDLNALIQEVVENLQPITLTHKLLIERTGEVHAYGDRDHIEQVLTNLLNNAIKYSPQANKVVIHVTTNQDYATISVQDFGIGIAEAYQQKIFERFYHIADPMESTFPGLGIGLYISREIIQRHNGSIWVESKKGEGSTFNVTIPLRAQTATKSE